MTSLDSVIAALTVWQGLAPEQPVTDSEIIVRAVAGDIDGVSEGLRLNARYRRAIAAGDRDAVAVILEDARLWVGPDE